MQPTAKSAAADIIVRQIEIELAMFKKIKDTLSKIMGISTPVGGVSWSPSPKESAYDVEDEYFIATSVANEEHVGESFQMCTALPRNALISELVKRIKFQLGIKQSLARTGKPPEGFNLDDISDPVVFDWNCTKLNQEMKVSDIAHGKIVIAIFDSSVPTPKAAFLTKTAIRDIPEIKKYLA